MPHSHSPGCSLVSQDGDRQLVVADAGVTLEPPLPQNIRLLCDCPTAHEAAAHISWALAWEQKKKKKWESLAGMRKSRWGVLPRSARWACARCELEASWNLPWVPGTGLRACLVSVHNKIAQTGQFLMLKPELLISTLSRVALSPLGQVAQCTVRWLPLLLPHTQSVSRQTGFISRRLHLFLPQLTPW